MISSSNSFNSRFSISTGVNLKGNAVNYRSSKQIASKKYSSTKYHFEFWKHKNGSLYACIHSNHKQSPTLDVLNLQEAIVSLQNLIKTNLISLLGFSPSINLNLKGGIGVSPVEHSHTLNVECGKDPVINAEIMDVLVRIVIGFKL